MTRPDLAFAVSYVSQFFQAPTDVHPLLVKSILRYLKVSLGCGIVLHAGDMKLTGYSDSDQDGCPDTRKSAASYRIFLGDSLVSWYSKKLPTVAKSSAEAEYKALSQLATDVMWISMLLEELNVPLPIPFHLFCDSMSTTCLALNPIYHSRTKHIELEYHFIRDLVAADFVEVHFIPSSEQVAYIFTKGLPFPAFILCQHKFLKCPLVLFEGEYKDQQYL